MRINRTITITPLIPLLLIIVMIGLYLINKVNKDSVRFNEKCISDSLYLRPNIRFLRAPIEIEEIKIDGKILYPADLINYNDSFMVGSRKILVKLIDGKIIMDSVCLEVNCLSYDVIINDNYMLKFEPSTYD